MEGRTDFADRYINSFLFPWVLKKHTTDVLDGWIPERCCASQPTNHPMKNDPSRCRVIDMTRSFFDRESMIRTNQRASIHLRTHFLTENQWLEPIREHLLTYVLVFDWVLAWHWVFASRACWTQRWLRERLNPDVSAEKMRRVFFAKQKQHIDPSHNTSEVTRLWTKPNH